MKYVAGLDPRVHWYSHFYKVKWVSLRYLLWSGKRWKSQRAKSGEYRGWEITSNFNCLRGAQAVSDVWDQELQCSNDLMSVDPWIVTQQPSLALSVCQNFKCSRTLLQWCIFNYVEHFDTCWLEKSESVFKSFSRVLNHCASCSLLTSINF